MRIALQYAPGPRVTELGALSLAAEEAGLDGLSNCFIILTNICRSSEAHPRLAAPYTRGNIALQTAD